MCEINHIKTLESLLGECCTLSGYGNTYYKKIREEKNYNPSFLRIQMICRDFDITLFDYCYLSDSSSLSCGSEFLIKSRKEILRKAENSQERNLIKAVYNNEEQYWIKAETIHCTLRKIRCQHKISASKLSEMTNNKITKRAIYRLEAVPSCNPLHSYPRANEIFFLCRLLGLTAQDIAFEFYKYQYIDNRETVLFKTSPVRKAVESVNSNSYNSGI